MKAVSRKRFSSRRWVFLFPVAGAATGSRPAYLHPKRKRVRTGKNTEHLECHGSTGKDERLPDRLGTVDGGAHAGLDVVVVSLVLMLLLTPDQVSIGIFLSLSLHQVERERRELWRSERENEIITQQ